MSDIETCDCCTPMQQASRVLIEKHFEKGNMKIIPIKNNGKTLLLKRKNRFMVTIQTGIVRKGD